MTLRCLSKHYTYYEGSSVKLDVKGNSNCCSIHIQPSSNKLVLHIGIVDGKFLCGDVLGDCGYCNGTGETQYTSSLGWPPTVCNICKGTGKAAPYFGSHSDEITKAFPDKFLCADCKKQAQDMDIIIKSS